MLATDVALYTTYNMPAEEINITDVEVKNLRLERPPTDQFDAQRRYMFCMGSNLPSTDVQKRFLERLNDHYVEQGRIGASKIQFSWYVTVPDDTLLESVYEANDIGVTSLSEHTKPMWVCGVFNFSLRLWPHSNWTDLIEMTVSHEPMGFIKIESTEQETPSATKITEFVED